MEAGPRAIEAELGRPGSAEPPQPTAKPARKLSAEARSAGGAGAPLKAPLRVAFAVLALAAIVAIAIPLASTSLVRQSEADARAGDLSGALAAARSAQNAQPGAATPRLQQALVRGGGQPHRSATTARPSPSTRASPCFPTEVGLRGGRPGAGRQLRQLIREVAESGAADDSDKSGYALYTARVLGPHRTQKETQPPQGLGE